jgi:hypothetical protein
VRAPPHRPRSPLARASAFPKFAALARASALATALALPACGTASPSSSPTTDAPARATSPPSSSSSSEPTPAPPYDAALDLRLRTAFAQSHLSPSARIATEPPLLLFAAPRDSRSFDPTLALVRSALPALYNARFSRRPERPITLYVFDDAKTYDAFVVSRYVFPRHAPFGFYEAYSREVVVDQHYGVTTILHELTHALLEDDFPRAPVWLREGISALYETPVLAGDEIHGAVGWRLPSLRKAMDAPAGGVTTTLDGLFAMSPGMFDGPEALPAYALARFACLWLDSPGQDHLWAFFHRWRDHVAEDPTGEKSFAEVVGSSPREANEAWQKWVRAL